MTDGGSKFFQRPEHLFFKSMTLVQSLEFGMLVVVDMCCVLSCPVAGFLLIVGVGGENPHECAVLVGGHTRHAKQDNITR